MKVENESPPIAIYRAKVEAHRTALSFLREILLKLNILMKGGVKMAGGRPRVLTANSKQNLTKEEIAQREKEEALLDEFPKIPVTPPKQLEGIAREEYLRIQPSLSMLPIADLDLGQVVAYCEFYQDFIESSEELKKEGMIVTAMNGDTKINPAFNAKEKAHQRMQSIARTIGMTVDSRLKIITPKVEEKSDKFDEFFD